MFAICGALESFRQNSGDLPVQDDVGFADVCASYYFTLHRGTSRVSEDKTDLSFVDYGAQSDRLASSAKT
jgi:hypothetical protein